MRYTRILAAIILSSALIFLLCFGSSAANTYKDTISCDHGMGVYFPLNSGAQKWVEFTPTITNNGTRFSFSGIEAELVNGNFEYAFDRFVFLLFPDNHLVEFEKGYIYTYNFTVRSTKVSNVNESAFSFGVSDYDFSFATPLGDVVYTYDFSGSTTVNYYITVSFYVDDSPSYNSLPNPEEAYLYLQISTEWSDTFSLIASNMTAEKAVGEDAYYQASLDAIQNLPDTEYNFILNKMPDAEGEVDAIELQADNLAEDFKLFTNDLYDVLVGVTYAEPLVYFPKMNIPILNIDLSSSEYFGKYISSDGFFKPLNLVADMNTSAMPAINLCKGVAQLILMVTFCTVGLEKMLRIEWWM